MTGTPLAFSARKVALKQPSPISGSEKAMIPPDQDFVARADQRDTHRDRGDALGVASAWPSYRAAGSVKVLYDLGG
jgi:hypothetical protein